MRENNQLVEFLDIYDYIKPLTYQSKIKIAYWGTDKHYSFGQKVYEEDSKVEFIYLIKKGEFEVTKEVFLNHDEK